MYNVITISRQHGSGGREIGRQLSQQLGIPFYDKEVIERAAIASSINKRFFESAESRGVGSLLYKISESLAADLRHDFSLEEKAYMAQRDVILEMAASGPCVIVGRGACEVLKGNSAVLRTYIYADMDFRVRRAVEEYHEPPENIEKRIRHIDKQRMAYYHFYEKKEILWTEHFDLCINSGKFGLPQTVQFICDAYRSGTGCP